MAKIVSPVWSEIRGSIAGTTYLTTPSGQIIARQRTHPVNPSSLYQNDVRGAFQVAVNDWTTMTAANRVNWQTWALAHLSKIDGRHAFLAGQGLFQYVSARGVLPVGATRTVNPPQFATVPALKVAPSAPTGPGTGVAFTIENQTAVKTMIWAELFGPFTKARNFWKGPWDATLPAVALVTQGTPFVAEFLGLVFDQRYFIRVRGVSADVTTGKQGNVVTTIYLSHSDAVTI